MIKRWTVAAVAGGLLAGVVPAPVASADPAVADSAYDLTIEMLDRAARADVLAREGGGFSVSNRSGTSASSGRFDCCAALRRSRNVWAPKAAASQSVTTKYDVDLRRGRYRISLLGRAWLVGNPTRVFARMQRTDELGSALRVAGRTGVRWMSGSADNPIPNLVPGDLYADAAAGLLPSMTMASLVGMPTNVTQLQRRETAAGTTYRGSMNRFGGVYSFGFTFDGDQLAEATLRTRGVTLMSSQWRYARPTIGLPGQDVSIGARALRAAYGYARFPAKTRDLADEMRKIIRNEQNSKWPPTDRQVVRFIRQALRFLGQRVEGPMGIVVEYRYLRLSHGGRLSVHNRFGDRRRTYTWDAARQRLQVTRVN